MILIGLLFFVIASLGPELMSVSKKPKAIQPNSKTQIVRNSPKAFKSKKALFNFRYPEHRSSTEIEKKIRQERRMATSEWKPKLDQSEMEMPTLDEIPEENSISSFYNTVHTKTTNSIQETREKMETIPIEEESSMIELNGLLFLDYSRTIPFQSKDLKSIQWSENMFQNFKRIGVARVQHKNNSFKFITGNLLTDFAYSDIAEVIFFDQAFSIIPKKRFLPVPLIFSEDVNKLKALIVKN
ncbi:MAG TPA: hypothetical protein PK079_08775 [Leptospiraceae bacterium]|nr:hypothetical protein [Leptospiraceae bacterium]HMX30604.1 hypothetical protein [Leptospiraceae bacterium]HMY31304.1 hypothetical protein [Leptospiraceae bacterium]HMZ63417.1 hypothetical protein [Leptospiraceae bacterium]HNA08393.1 hypothetical protein [Leptospiraceae bacterium]